MEGEEPDLLYQLSYGKILVPAGIKAGEGIRVSVTVKNTGKAPGKEAVQLYIRDKSSSLPHPPKELLESIPKFMGRASKLPQMGMPNFQQLDNRLYGFF